MLGAGPNSRNLKKPECEAEPLQLTQRINRRYMAALSSSDGEPREPNGVTPLLGE